LRVLTIAAAFAALAGAAQAAAAPSHSYEFSGNLADSLGGPSMQIGAGSSYVGSGLSGGLDFASNLGPNLSNAFASSTVYSIEMYFSLDALGGYRRLVDFKNQTTDEGLYFFNDALTLYNTSQFVDVNATAGSMVHLVLTRDAGSQFNVYYNGGLAISRLDASRTTLTGPNQIVRFFDDDGGEASAGFVDFIRTYDVALTGSDVTGLYNGGAPLRGGETGAVPAPATWAMMILGFGGVGATLRTRRRLVAA
jgi:hypothetical protein